MTSRFTDLAVDCSDPNALAQFWCAALGYVVYEQEDELVTIGPPRTGDAADDSSAGRSGPTPPTLTFARVAETKTIKNRLHLDLNPTDRDQGDEVRRLLDLGARHVDVGQREVSWVVLADPEGNEFCVLASRRP